MSRYSYSKMPPHHSYKEFYDAKVPEKLPFNQTPPRLAGEKSDFVSLPVKCNSPMQRNKKEFTLSDLYRDPRKAVPIDDDSCLSFEKAIRKYMSNTVVEEEMKSTLNCNEPISSGTHTIPGTGIPRIEDSPMLGHFPSSSQWTILDQLRIHAGSPERSENGIAMLIEYL